MWVVFSATRPAVDLFAKTPAEPVSLVNGRSRQRRRAFSAPLTAGKSTRGEWPTRLLASGRAPEQEANVLASSAGLLQAQRPRQTSPSLRPNTPPSSPPSAKTRPPAPQRPPALRPRPPNPHRSRQPNQPPSFPRFPPSKAFGRRPQSPHDRSATGRRPKPFTGTEIQTETLCGSKRARWSFRPASAPTSADHGMSRAQHAASDVRQSGSSTPYARLSLSLSRRELAGRRAGVG